MGVLLIKRYIWLINLLNRYSEQGLTLKAINSEWERSTYYKDCGDETFHEKPFVIIARQFTVFGALTLSVHVREPTAIIR